MHNWRTKNVSLPALQMSVANGIFLLFALLHQNLATIYHKDLRYQSDLITKETIIRDHDNLDKQSRVKSVPTLAYISPENENGYALVTETAHRLTYVSPAWFDVSLNFEWRDDIQVIVATIHGRENIKTDFIQAVLKENPNILIVPVFKFNEIPPAISEALVEENVHIKIIAADLAYFCQSLKFDGLVVDIYNVLMDNRDRSVKLNALEAMATLGESLRDFELLAILPISPPFKSRQNRDQGSLGSEQCALLTSAFAHVQLNTFETNSILDTVMDWQPWVTKNVERCGNAPNLMLGVSFHGYEFDYKEFKQNNNEHAREIDAQQYLDDLEDELSLLTFATEIVGHQLHLRFDNKVIFFPSLTSLEYRQRIIQELKLSMAIHDYGKGLDYFTNLI